MRQIRNGVFETNSSSTHSLTMCTQEEFDKWINGEILFDYYNGCFREITKLSEKEKMGAREHYNRCKSTYWKDWGQLSEDEIQEWYNSYFNTILRQQNSEYEDLMTYADWQNNYDLEQFIQHYTSPSGDKIVAFGKYGYDG